MKVFGVVGWKNAGKTGLMERLVAEITARGITVSTVKHAHHTFDVDQPGKDSFRHRKAGAREVLLSSRRRWALMHESKEAEEEAPLAQLLARITPVDLVLVEGFKRDDHPKVEAYRHTTGNPLIAPDDPTVKAIAADVPLEQEDLPVFDLNDTTAIADFILAHTGLGARADVPIHDPSGLAPPPLRDDCFALPPGVEWVPVDEALAALETRLDCAVGQEKLMAETALGRILATDVAALRANPPGANSAVDGYGFRHASISDGPQVLPLEEGRSAAGAPFEGSVTPGKAVRILTGALLPEGVDTVIMQEDVTAQDGKIAFHGGMRKGANVRKAGEDTQAGQTALRAGRLLGAADLGFMAAIGVRDVSVFRKLRVGVLSTGDEIVPPGSDLAPAKTYDANRPMLLGMVRNWGYEAHDLGHVADSRESLRARLDEAARTTDVILTSGGASAGEEDHVSALLEETGSLFSWRIAIKPGRPLALAIWNGVPVFGLPGNPVAAFVCTAVFARPALSRLAGGPWLGRRGFLVPAAFEKRKKAGRREFLRARLDRDGAAEVFASEGSGRISGLSWADGLVELDDGARDIQKGDLVKYIPYADLGL